MSGALVGDDPVEVRLNF